MSQAKKILMAGATFSAALGIGFVMQNGDALAARFGSETAQVQPAQVAPVAPAVMQIAVSSQATDVAAEGPALMQLAANEVAPAVVLPVDQLGIVYAESPVQLAAVEVEAPAAPLMSVQPEPALPSQTVATVDCSIDMAGTAVAGAMVALVIDAPCQTGAEFIVHHQGMMFTALTDDAGHAELTVPALGLNSVFVAAFASEDGAMASVEVPELALYDRAVLQWQGDLGVSMQVYEFGAEYGAAGNVNAANPRGIDALAEGQGFMVALGETGATDSYRAEVYTYPVNTSSMTGNILVSVDAQITAGNCGREVTAQSIQITAGEDPTGEDLVMTMPDCDGVGDILVLNAMFDEIMVAMN